MGTTTDKTTYLNNTKLKIKDGINRLGGELTNLSTFRSYAEALDNIYDKLPKVTGTGSNVSLSPTLKGALGTIPLGNCEQNGTPTPDTPQPIRVVTGENSVVVSNKNLFVDLEDYSSTNLTFTKNNDGSYTLNGMSTYSRLFSVQSNLKQGNYSLQVEYEGTLPNNANGFVQIYNASPMFNAVIANNETNGVVKNFTVSEDATTVQFRIRVEENFNYQNVKIYPNLVKGTYTASTMPDFVAHAEQTYPLSLGTKELCKIGTYEDKIVGSKDNWKIVRNVGKVIYDGSNDENWGNYVANAFTISVDNIKQTTSTGDTPDILSNYYKATTQANINNNTVDYGITTRANQNVIIIKNKDIADVNTLKTWLSTHNVIVYYVLATPTEETITDTTLINELNGLQDLLSYDGTTNITITSDSDNAQMLVQVSALKGE